MFISKLASFPDPCPAGWVSGNEAVLKQCERDYDLPELGRKPVWSPLSKWAAAVQERSRSTVHHLDPNTITIHISRSGDLAWYISGLILSPHMIKSLGTRLPEGSWLTSE